MERDGGESTKLVFEDSKLDSDLCGDPKQLTGANFAMVRRSGPFEDSDATLRDSTFELPCAVLVEEMEGTLVQQTTNHVFQSVKMKTPRGDVSVKTNMYIVQNQLKSRF